MKLRPMLQVSDIPASSRWYQSAVGLRSGHGGDEFEMLFDGDDFVLQLHGLDAHEHGMLSGGADTTRGAGVSLWFETTDRLTFEAKVEQARAAGATIAVEPNWNPLAHHYEATLVDLDGYVVVLCTPFGTEP
jgi:catechol 2,3-dioxygenase-like lactoylglutathione lyase family enzyme